MTPRAVVIALLQLSTLAAVGPHAANALELSATGEGQAPPTPPPAYPPMPPIQRPSPIPSDWINAMTWGAKGDGKTDDTKAIVRAVNASFNASRFGHSGGVLCVESFRVRVARTLCVRGCMCCVY